MNSSRRVSNQNELSTIVKYLTSNARKKGTRALVVLQAPTLDWLASYAANIRADYIGPGTGIDRADRISALLGSERHIAIVQLENKPDLGLLAATGGTIKAGGALVIGTGLPAEYTGDEQNRRTICCNPRTPSRSTRRLGQLASQLMETHSGTAICLTLATEQSGTVCKTTTESSDICSAVDASGQSSKLRHRRTAAKNEQDALLKQACNHLSSHDSSCIAITGRRGRGKSTLLARIASYLEQSESDFHITALNESALSSFNDHAGDLKTRYISPELAAIKPLDILLVDEAASFSLKLLERFASNCRHLILCSTTEGYEASGRAFDVRLLSSFSGANTTRLHLKPTTPWRWADNDPVEIFIDRLLLNHNGYASGSADVSSDVHHAGKGGDQVRQITQDELLHDEQLLTEVHTLLNTSHYQTTTKDLEHLLDAPSLQLWAQMLDNRVVGVLLLEHEGQIKQELHSAILCKQRRLKNQLLPQLLAQMADDSSALHRRYGRVIRIAVVPEFRRQGLASGLVSCVTGSMTTTANVSNDKQLTDAFQNFDAIGASFASDACSQAFWKSLGFAEYHRGFKANPRSGQFACAVLRCFEPVTQCVLNTAIDIHQDNEKARVSRHTAHDVDTGVTPLTARDLTLLSRFADGQRSAHDSFAALWRLSTVVDLPTLRNVHLSTKQYELQLRANVTQWVNENRTAPRRN